MSLIDFCALDGNPNNVVPQNVNIVSMRSEHHSCYDTPNECQWLISNLLVVLLKRHPNHMLDLPAKRRSSSIANVNSLTICHREVKAFEIKLQTQPDKVQMATKPRIPPPSRHKTRPRACCTSPLSNALALKDGADDVGDAIFSRLPRAELASAPEPLATLLLSDSMENRGVTQAVRPSKFVAFTSQPCIMRALSVSRDEHQCKGVPPYFISCEYNLLSFCFKNAAMDVGVEILHSLETFLALRFTSAPANSNAVTQSFLSARQAKCSGV
uniref:Uncharacterized protein n=1 Tax=Glossina pallidipes TaxID=7398 RepID=A0A1A9Z348_GLOPL